MSIVAIIASNSRQGLVSLSLAILFFASVYLYFNKRNIGIVTIIFSIFFSLLAILGMLQKGPFVDLLYKASVSIRGYYWQAAIEMFKSEPLFGVGFDHYGYYFKQFRSVDYPLRYGFDLTSTNAHNTFLQMFATGGVFVGLSYLLLVVATLFAGLKVVKNSNSNNQIIALGIVSAWVAFQAQSVISIDNIGVSVWGWLLTGAIFGLARDQELEKKCLEGISPKKSFQTQIMLLPFLLCVSIFIPILILSVLLMRVESNTFLARGATDEFVAQTNKSSNLSQNLLQISDKHADYVLSSFIADANYKIQISYNYFNIGDTVKSLEIAQDLIRENPRNLYVLEAAAILSAELGENLNALNVRNRIAELDPWNAKNYLQIMLLYKELGNIPSAENAKDKILSFASSTPEAKIALEEFAK
jgi:hypothetical protein